MSFNIQKIFQFHNILLSYFFPPNIFHPSATFFEIQSLNFTSWAHYVSLFMMPMKGNIPSKMRSAGGFSLTKVESRKCKLPEEWRSREGWERTVSLPHQKGKMSQWQYPQCGKWLYLCFDIFTSWEQGLLLSGEKRGRKQSLKDLCGLPSLSHIFFMKCSKVLLNYTCCLNYLKNLWKCMPCSCVSCSVVSNSLWTHGL